MGGWCYNRMEIGVDLTEIRRFIPLNEKNRALSKIFTDQEIQYCRETGNPAQHFAVRFAGKEAVIKAFYPYGEKLFPNQIEILNTKDGIPQVSLLTGNYDRYEIKISLSHTDDTAVAFAMINRL